jgi:hypothetical protein
MDFICPARGDFGKYYPFTWTFKAGKSQCRTKKSIAALSSLSAITMSVLLSYAESRQVRLVHRKDTRQSRRKGICTTRPRISQGLKRINFKAALCYQAEP